MLLCLLNFYDNYRNGHIQNYHKLQGDRQGCIVPCVSGISIKKHVTTSYSTYFKSKFLKTFVKHINTYNQTQATNHLHARCRFSLNI